VWHREDQLDQAPVEEGMPILGSLSRGESIQRGETCSEVMFETPKDRELRPIAVWERLQSFVASEQCLLDLTRE
jgi:hypothetical protein